MAIRLTVCIVAIGLLSLPAFFFSISSNDWNLDWIPRTSIYSLSDLLFSYAGAFDERATSLTVIITGLYLVGVGLAVFSTQKRDSPTLAYLLLSILVPIALTVVFSMVKPLFVSRYLLIGLPLFCLARGNRFPTPETGVRDRDYNLRPKSGGGLFLLPGPIDSGLAQRSGICRGAFATWRHTGCL